MKVRCIVVAALLAACSHNPARATVSAPPLLIEGRGTTMPLSQVMTHIMFRPFLPSSQVLAYAVLPPLGGSDTDAHRGIGIEYLAGSDAMLLSQWPAQNFKIAFKPNQPAIEPCKPVHYNPLAVAWTTRHNHLVMTLQPDGTASAAAVDSEVRHLIRAGACR
jgi:hypothetical protein